MTITPSSTVLDAPRADSSLGTDDRATADGSARAVARVLESIGLDAPSETLLRAAGAGLWLRFDPLEEPALFDGLHPDRLLRTCFALDIWAMRSHLLSANLVEFLAEHARPELPIVVDVDPVRWTGDPVIRPVGRLVVTEVEAHEGEARVRGFGPTGEVGEWPATRVVAASTTARADAPAGAVTLHQPLVRRLHVEPSRIVRGGLCRVVWQMRRSIPSLGATGFAAFDALRRELDVGGTLPASSLDDLGRGDFVDVLHLAAEILERPAILVAAERFAEAAEAWRELARSGSAAETNEAPRRITEIESLERRSIDEIADAVAPRVTSSGGIDRRDRRLPGPAPDLAAYEHRRGVHCASMALHNLARHYLARKWSESLCFGLAAGLNFTYLREPGSPMFLLMGRGSDMEEHFTDAVGGHLETFRSDDDERAFDHLLCQLEAGRLVVLEADMFHLPYMVQSLELMEGVHFGGHKLFVTGYDADAGTVVVYDYAWKEPIVLPVEQLRRARGSRECPEPPRNGCFVFRFPDEPTPLAEAIPRALRTLVQQMRRPFMQWNGLPAVDRFCRQAARWSRVMEPEELELNVRLAGFMFERAGTGGGNFRNLYHRFLREAAEILDAPELAEIAADYRRLAGHWREVASLLDEAAEDPSRGLFDPARDAQALLDAIRDTERRAVDAIDAFLCQ